uniref:uncharacterized protein LOC122585314 n=1 Tax=Erigeron canadensis TaxID=72917 RepID=UPI001CB91772|nr:uncharacterized protein LOC122585314 [Erigeron canadensis]
MTESTSVGFPAFIGHIIKPRFKINTTICGQLQQYYALTLINNDFNNCENGESNNGSISMETCRLTRNDGKVQSYCGLKLQNSQRQSSTNIGLNSISAQSATFIARNGTTQTYWALKLVDTMALQKNSMHHVIDEAGPSRIPSHLPNSGTQNIHDAVSNANEVLGKKKETSSVAKAFRMARNWTVQNNENNCRIRLIGQGRQASQYNRPTVSEVAVLVTNDFDENTEPRDIIVRARQGGLQRISELHQLYIALQYPLLFPYGETGYHEHILYHNNTGPTKTKWETVIMREFYSYRIHYRHNESTTILRGGRLYQQYLVDSYTTVEEERLRYTRTHQKELRADVYNNVCDAVTKGDTQAKAIGKRIVLPATFTGSPRYMMQNYQDAMALCWAFGNPDLFITFTANPQRLEVGKMVSLINGQPTHERSESVTRVFKMKLDILMEDIMKKKIFGACKAGIYTIEFQKRGLPHAHILIWLDVAAKCKTPEEIDDLISAEIPLQSEDPDGHEAVVEFMLHGPCGVDSPNASCTFNTTCLKHFPKPFYQSTTIDDDGYPVYRRRKNNVSVMKGKAVLLNGFVVPYNRFLLLKYRAHINVEWCNRSRAIKYLFKYHNKGPDRVTMVEAENVVRTGPSAEEKIVHIDEIKNYQDCRYLSPCEAVWRMFAFISTIPILQLLG